VSEVILPERAHDELDGLRIVTAINVRRGRIEGGGVFAVLVLMALAV
jgi:hypothetical protein